jgi:2-methylisocitrate lyase-like PEP mutase family enzyme
MSNPEQTKKAETLRALHHCKEPLLLPNVWDSASARIIEDAGYPALATTSAGVAFAQGFPDGQKIPAERLITAVAQIVSSVRIPVTADVEAGYGSQPEDAARTASRVIEVGAVGMNFEDASGHRERPLLDLQLQVDRIRETSAKLGIPLVLNARTDVYLLQVGEPATRYKEALRRVRAFRAAGADCVFVPGVRDVETIRRIVADADCPVNILAVPGSPSVPELAALGVKRISLGSGPMRATLGLLQKLAAELRMQGTLTSMDGAPSHAEVNALMNRNEN